MTVTSTIDLQDIAIDFTANTLTGNDERLPDVVGLSGGGFATAYVSGDFTLVDFFDGAGNVQGTYRIPYDGATRNTGDVAIAQRGDGDVVVMWVDNEADHPGPRAHLFSATGDPIGGEVQLFADGTGYELPSLVTLDDGTIELGVTGGGGVFAAQLNSNLTVSNPHQVSTAISGVQTDSSVAALADGGFVVTYTDTDPADQTIRATIYNADNSVRGTSDFVLASGGDNTQSSTIGLQNGGFATVYTDTGWNEGGTLGAGITLQLSDANGAPTGFIHVNSASTVDESDPDITQLANGYLLVTWSRPDAGNPADTDIFAQIFDQSGNSVTGFAFGGTVNPEAHSSVAHLFDGVFTAAWEVTENGDQDIHQSIRELVRTSIGDGASDTIEGDALRDSIDGGGGDDFILAGGANDTILGGIGADTAFGGAGDDVMLGGDGADSLDGEGGSDTASYAGSATAVSIDLEYGSASGGDAEGDVLTSIENLVGSDEGDTLLGTSLDNRIEGGLGGDILFAYGGTDTLLGGAGDDTIQVRNLDGGDVLDGGEGEADILFVFGQASYDFRTSTVLDIEKLNIAGSTDGATASFNAGQFAFGSIQADEHAGKSVIVNVYMDDTTTTLSLAGLTLGGFNQPGDRFAIFGDGDAESLTGSAIADSIDGGAGADTMAGGAGNDAYFVDDSGDRVSEGVNGGYDAVSTTLASYALGANLERLNFTDTGAHTGRGNELSNRINGNAGLDKFIIDAGGNDIFSGGSGEDSFDARSSATGMILRLDTQASNAGSVTGDTFASIEKFFGSNTAADTMTTGAARAKFFGFGGNDTLTGGASIDALSGGAGADKLIGNAGQDALDGGTGNDTMTGGADRDLFTFVDAAFGKDIITDFEDGADRLKIFSAVADNFNDFAVSGNGTHHVVLTLVAGQTLNTITLNNAAANITVSAADFLFY